ncbi:MAG: exosome complex RNA-binding protein Csl4 [Candidatus Odinarchaeia archaeon]
MKKEMRTGSFVLPGDKLGVIEEYLPGAGTFQEKGVIFSSKVGIVLIDTKAKKISVFPRTVKPLIPKKGNIVKGKIMTVQGKKAIVSIAMVGDKILSSTFTGQIFIRQVTGEYIDTMEEAFKVGDIVKAMVIDDRDEVYQLSTADPKMGVTKANCTRCGGTLIKFKNQLKCVQCGNLETRKTSTEYDSN